MTQLILIQANFLQNAIRALLDLFKDITKENLLDQFLLFPPGNQILVLQGGQKADCVPEAAAGVFVQAVPAFDEGDGYKSAHVILLFGIPK